MTERNARDAVIEQTKCTGILPAIKLKQHEDILPYARALYEGGARVIEITMTTPGVLEAIQTIVAEFGLALRVGAGTVLDAATARAALLAGASLIVNPALIPEVIATAHRYGAACYSGAFTATECLQAMQAGADMVKVFPAALGGPKYMTNLRMVYPEISLIPSGGINLENAPEFIECGACAISGSRNFVDREMVRQHGLAWITDRTSQYMRLVSEAKGKAKPLP
jgi:2-dehydro-3-deoxyphosphogluconate aldolase/(4S)-4-hydroxy-2-oxoglutarate aldolase